MFVYILITAKKHSCEENTITNIIFIGTNSKGEITATISQFCVFDNLLHFSWITL